MHTVGEEKKSFTFPATAETTFESLTKELRLYLQIDPDMECQLRHHGHKMAGGTPIGQKSPLEMQQTHRLLELSTLLTYDQLMMHNAPALADFAKAQNIKISKGASKVEIAQAIIGEDASKGSAQIAMLKEENDLLKERLRVLEKQATKQTKSDHKPKANTNHQATEDSESTS